MAKLPSEIAGILIPTAHKTLLLPNVAVAEVDSYLTPTPRKSANQPPPWLLGDFHWRYIDVPVISYEVFNGEPRPDIAADARLAVLNGIGGYQALRFFAIETQGIPRLARVYPQEVHEEGQTAGEGELMKVKVNGEDAVIPDLEKMEEALLSLE